MKLDLPGTIARSRRLHCHVTDAGLNRSLRPIAVAHHSLSFVLVLQLAMAPHKLRHLRFHCLLQQLTRSVSQNLRQRIRHWQSDAWIPILNYAIFFHGVFSLEIRLMVRGKTHQEYATYFICSYPTFKHNSRFWLRSETVPTNFRAFELWLIVEN